MDVHPTRDLVVSVSEDASICAWRLPLTPAAAAAAGGGGGGGGGGSSGGRGAECGAPVPLLSAAVLGSSLWGVAFCGEGGGDVAAVAYDGDDLMIWKGAAAM